MKQHAQQLLAAYRRKRHLEPVPIARLHAYFEVFGLNWQEQTKKYRTYWEKFTWYEYDEESQETE